MLSMILLLKRTIKATIRAKGVLLKIYCFNLLCVFLLFTYKQTLILIKYILCTYLQNEDKKKRSRNYLAPGSKKTFVGPGHCYKMSIIKNTKIEILINITRNNSVYIALKNNNQTNLKRLTKWQTNFWY